MNPTLRRILKAYYVREPHAAWIFADNITCSRGSRRSTGRQAGTSRLQRHDGKQLECEGDVGPGTTTRDVTDAAKTGTLDAHCEGMEDVIGLIQPMATRRKCWGVDVRTLARTQLENRRRSAHGGRGLLSPRYRPRPPLPSRPRRPRPLSRSTAGCSGCAPFSPPFSPYVFPAPQSRLMALLTRVV